MGVQLIDSIEQFCVKLACKLYPHQRGSFVTKMRPDTREAPDAKELRRIKTAILAGVKDSYLRERFHRSHEVIRKIRREVRESQGAK